MKRGGSKVTYTPVKLEIDGVSFELNEKHNFDWIHSLGKVFCVFDQQDSGNIGFGVDKDGEKKFIKYAGARTVRYSGEPEDAVERLKQSVDLYKKLSHPVLIKLENHFQIGKGYALVFEWFKGENLHPHWEFPPPLKYNHPQSPFYRFKQLTINDRLQSINSIFDFHVHVEFKDFVAVDFYDGSILYDFGSKSTKICDIDVYQKKPFINTMGRLWGSSRFMSPEEFQMGAVIDERTNVFNMGALAFSLLGGEMDRSLSKWEAGRPLYEVALKANEKDRRKRYSSVSEFYSAWESAIKHN